ncbi:hypothetical protein [Porphyrobacter sp. AAP60]|uniref:hypothetical protein n=1 Tax=Porphyrobacter sp. AAP60 TaxID=1523423 RepID=UPI0006B8829B|nr:hypothetical protein [Porphyrobacter sp. AAP60]KPF63510.1 hypothetical protein IP79_06110 [Porphyrobacter sp. AAP60]
MADYLDKRIGNFCQSIQQLIDEYLPVSSPQKQKFIEMLNDCADRADKSPEDSIGFMRRELQPLRQQIKFQTGKDLRIS